MVLRDFLEIDLFFIREFVGFPKEISPKPYNFSN
jgi:hypothetical protein